MQIASAFSHMLNLHNMSENAVTANTVRSPTFFTSLTDAYKCPATWRQCTCQTSISNEPLSQELQLYIWQVHILPTCQSNVDVQVQFTVAQHIQRAFKLLSEAGCSDEKIYEALCNQSVDLVFTAHPTQAMRESVRTKYDTMHTALKHMQTLDESCALERGELQESIKAAISAAWYVSTRFGSAAAWSSDTFCVHLATVSGSRCPISESAKVVCFAKRAWLHASSQVLGLQAHR